MFRRRQTSPPASACVPTRAQSLALQPQRSASATLTLDAAGSGRLRVPIRPPRLASWLSVKLEGRTKTFELDAVGVFVWQQLDGTTSVEQLIRSLAARYNLDLRQSEAATTAFLRTLMQRGLIGVTATSAEAIDP